MISANIPARIRLSVVGAGRARDDSAVSLQLLCERRGHGPLLQSIGVLNLMAATQRMGTIQYLTVALRYLMKTIYPTGVQALLALASEAYTPAFALVPAGNLPLVPTSRLGIFLLLSFPRGAWKREGDLTAVTQDVGRNKAARRQQGWTFPAIGAPEKLPLLLTPLAYIRVGKACLRLTRGQAYLCPIGYSGLRRDVYNDERGVWKREGDLTAVTQCVGRRQI